MTELVVVNGLKVPEKYRGLFERAAAGKSRTSAIRAHCLMCVGFQLREVEHCTATSCPLYNYRMVGVRSPLRGLKAARVDATAEDGQGSA